MAKDSVTLALKSGSIEIPALTIFALEHCGNNLEKLGEGGTVLASSRVMCNIFAAAMLDTSPDITSDVLGKRVTTGDYKEMDRALVELLHISGMMPEEGDETSGETKAAA